jgi:hypothetical protein
MGRLSKIDHLGLSSRILSLQASGIKTSHDIAVQLTRDGHTISQPTVSRWLKEQREKQKSETQKLVEEHVKSVIPADLDALEEMETQCLERAREGKGDFAHRLAALYIDEKLDAWREIFRELELELLTDPAKAYRTRMVAVKSIMSQCLIMTANDLALEKMRGNARRTATLIIDLKLKHTLGDGGSSNIIIGGMDDDESRDTGHTSGNVLVFKGEG